MIIEMMGGMLMFWCGLKAIIDWHHLRNVPIELRRGYLIFGILCLILGFIVLAIVSIRFFDEQTRLP